MKTALQFVKLILRILLVWFEVMRWHFKRWNSRLSYYVLNPMERVWSNNCISWILASVWHEDYIAAVEWEENQGSHSDSLCLCWTLASAVIILGWFDHLSSKETWPKATLVYDWVWICLTEMVSTLPEKENCPASSF